MARLRKRKAKTAAAAGPSKKKPKMVEQQLKLTDVIDDCLIIIFNHLSMKDLVSVVECDDHFLTAAQTVFKSKFGKIIHVSNRCDVRKEKVPPSVKLLKYFGSQIDKIIFNYYDEYRRYDKTIEDVINAECHKTLMEIEIKNADKLFMINILKPFEKLTVVRFINGTISQMISEFGKWFPVAHTLELKGQKVPYSDEDLIIKNYPALEHLKLVNISGITANGKIKTGNLKNFIILNPQLKSLCIKNDDMVETPRPSYRRQSFLYDSSDDEYDSGFDIDDELLKLIHQKLPKLEKFHINHPLSIFRDLDDTLPAKELQFEHLKNLTIKFRQPGSSDVIPISSKKIETLDLIESTLHGNCIDMIMKNQNARVVKLVGKWSSTETVVRMISLAAKLRNLNELKFPYQMGVVQPRQIIELLTNCKLLKKLTVVTFHIKNENCNVYDRAYDNIVASTGTDWKVDVHKTMNVYDRYDYRLVFEKKD